MKRKMAKKRRARVSAEQCATWARRVALIAGVTLLAPTPGGNEASAQSDPTAIGAGQRPYIMLLVDSSASMEFSLEGEQFYACYQREPDGAGTKTCRDSSPGPDPFNATTSSANPPEVGQNGGNVSYFTWRADYPIGDRAEEYDDDYSDPETGPSFVGPCYVWKDECDDYSRPPWYPGMLEDGENNNDEKSYDDRMWDRLNAMRGTASAGSVSPDYDAGTAIRLTDDNQPRHVQIKEILTGDMILKPRDLITGQPVQTFLANPKIHGPGCWFVPRMANTRTAKDQWHMCRKLDANNNPTGWESNHDNAFQNLVDYNDPRPHHQEVFDYQLTTGLMDNLANIAIFSVATFDGYPGILDSSSGQVRPANHNASKQPIIDDGISASGNHVGGFAPEDDQSYNLGVYKVVGPTRLDVPSSQLSAISTYSQYAVVDTGYMRNGGKKEFTIDPEENDSRLPYAFPAGLERYVLPYQMGHQPISGATPLAAAMRDIHMFMMNGQVEFDKDGQAENPNKGQWDPFDGNDAHKDLRKDGDKFIVNPVQTDPYKRCRPKHVVMMTDGFPQPERPDDLNPDGPLYVGNDRLDEAFGYTEWPSRYNYDTAENEIDYFVNNSDLNDVEGGNESFLPRVHVVGLNLAEGNLFAGNGDPAIADIHEKLGRMARSGKTCALFHLLSGEGKRYVPSAWGTFNVDGTPIQGTCDPGAAQSDTNAANCLVQQLPAGSFDYKGLDCIAPAILLSDNDRFQDANVLGERPVRDDLTEALQLVFNEVISDAGGVASRTTVGISNTLDDEQTRGQYRVFSGLDISGGNVYWEGLLERQTLECAVAGGSVDNSNTVRSLHNDIDLQVIPDTTSPDGYRDNRRIFTSIALAKSGDPVLKDQDAAEAVPVTGGGLILTTYEMATVDSGDDEFEGSARGFSSEAHVRVPFELDSVTDAANHGTPTSPPEARWLELFNAPSEDEARSVVSIVRGRIAQKQNRVFGPILNSNPVVVGPPALDLPIDSYRAFRDKYANRATMLYTSTLDGMLHAVHTGTHDGLEIAHSDFNGSEESSTRPVIDGTRSQREAWAYSPEMIRSEYYPSRIIQPTLLDGTPVVQDVRLCHGSAALNQNKQACKSSQNGTAVPPEDQWRTVLVQGRGQAGSGYFALDVTQSGGELASGDRQPDPIPLWEFDWRWEQRQIIALGDSNAGRYKYDPSTTPPDQAIIGGQDGCESSGGVLGGLFQRDELALFPFMGISVGEPAIGSVVLQGIGPDSSIKVQRPVAIFTAGQNGDIPGSSACRVADRRGRAIYVVDLQTGSLIRRFLDYFPIGSSSGHAFETEITGTPAMYSARAGTVATRAFVGDAAGRLFRLNLTDPNPENWRVDLFYDPCEDDDLKSQAGVSCDPLEGESISTRPRPWGPASFKPAVALDQQRALTVVYGLGERADTSVGNQIQAMVALKEDLSVSNPPIKSWGTTFPEDPTNSTIREKLTGPPVIFNYGVYFTTFTEGLDNACAPGLSRVWGLRMIPDDNSPGLDGVLDFRGSAASFAATDIEFSNDAENELVRWYEPQQPALIRGVTIALPPSCTDDFTNPADPSTNKGPTQARTPELLVSTGGAQNAGSNYDGSSSGSSANDLSTGAAGKINFGAKKLAAPTPAIKPLSWAILGD